MPYTKIVSEIHNIDKDTLKEIEESFAFATGLGVVFTDPNGTHLGQGSNFCSFCKTIHEHPLGLSSCFSSNKTAAQRALKQKKPYIYLCHAGLIDIEIPIIINDKFVGSVMAGQVRCTDCTPHDFPRIGEQDFNMPWFNTNEFKQKREQTVTMTKKRIIAAANSLFVLANYIVDKNIKQNLEEELLKKQEILFQQEKKRTVLEHSLRFAKLSALQKQIDPHFMFNILSSIIRLLELEEIENAQSILETFTKMLRYSLHNKTNVVTLEQELNYIEQYLYLQNFRFGNRVSFNIDVDDSLKSLSFPFFSLQVFVENAIIHGLEPLDREGIVKILGREEPDVFTITIKDNGTGMNQAELNQFFSNIQKSPLSEQDHLSTDTHYGLANTIERLKLHFEDAFDYQVQSTKNIGTQIILRVQKTFQH